MTINQDQIEFWNSAAGESWVSGQESIDRFMAPITERLLGEANPRAGEAVIDVGCGTGQTSLLAAAAVAPGGTVRGVDISQPMLAHAEDRAKAAGLTNVSFAKLDAQSASLGAEADLIMSRFGVMFFEDPVAAFANMHAHGRAGGRLCFVCWQAPKANPWAYIGIKAARAHIAPPDSPADPHAPGPFAFSDKDRVAGLLAEAGWQRPEITDVQLDINWSDTAEEGALLMLDRGPVRRLIDGESDAVKEAVIAEIASALKPLETKDGVFLGAAVWIVKAEV